MARIDHVAIQVENLQEALQWYIDRFDAVVEYQDETWAMLNFYNTKLALTMANQHPPHIAIVVNSLEDFPCRSEDIKEHRDGSKYLYVHDPAGNVIEYIYYEPPEPTIDYIHLP